ncbi:MAG: FtsX-like permease family protein [Bacteroides sp.]
MHFVLFIATRYLFTKKARTAVNIISLIAMVGICVSTMALVVVLSVFNGITSLVGGMYSSLDTDLRIIPQRGKVFQCDSADLAWLRAQPEIEHIGRTLEENALFGYQDKQHLGRLLGVDTEYAEMVALEKYVIEGEFRLERGSQPLLLPAAGMTYILRACLAQFDGITVYIPNRTAKNWLNPTTAFRKKTMGWDGILSINGDFDEQTVVAPIVFVQNMLDYDTMVVSSLALGLKKGVSAHILQNRVAAHFGERCKVLSHKEQNASLYRTMHSERLVIVVILSLILLIAMFNIVGSLSMLAIDKQRDMFIFSSLGATLRQVRRIFICEGVLLSLVGGGAGLLLGLVLSLLQEYTGVIALGSSGTFVVDAYPVAVHFGDLLFTFLLVVVLGYIASVLALRRRSFSRVVN